MESSENPLCEVLSGTERGLYNILFSSTLPEVLESSSRGWWRAEVYNYRWIKKKQKSNTKEHKKERKYGTGSSNKKILSYIGQYLSHKLYVTLPDGLNSPLLGYFRWPYRIADSLVKQFLLCPFIFKNLNNSQLNDLEIWIINTIKKKKKVGFILWASGLIHFYGCFKSLAMTIPSWYKLFLQQFSVYGREWPP